MKTKIRRRCKCGCGRITNLGRRYIKGHTWKGRKLPEDVRIKKSISAMGNVSGKGNKGNKLSNEHKRKIGLASKGRRHSKESILKSSVSRVKYDPNYPYCDSWRDIDYRDDLRKDYCENVDCKKDCNILNNHHIDLNKKNCHPKNIMTLCASCHIILHRKLEGGKHISINPKDFLVINRPDHVSYINKRARKKVVNVKRVGND